MNNTTQTLIDPCLDGIRPHACIKHIPQWPDNSPRMENLRRDIQSSGFCAPVLMTPKHEIVDPDSRERWRAARALQLACIPIATVPDGQVITAMLHALGQRRHLTKSAIAYLAFPVVKIALDEAQRHAAENLRKGQCSPSGTPCRTAKSIEEIADNIGISATLLKEARRVHEIFDRDPSFKAQMEPRLLAEPIGGEHESNRPVGLGAIIAGYAGKANEDKARSDRSQLELFTDAMKRFCIRAPQVDEAAARKIVHHQFASMSPEEIDAAIATAAIVVSEGRALNKATK